MKQKLRLADEVLSVRVGDLYARGAPVTNRWLVGRAVDLFTEVELELTPSEDVVGCVYRRRGPRAEAEEVRYALAVSWSPANLGGRRAVLHCAEPGCNRPVRRLFLDDPYLVCRRCAGICYRSQVAPSVDEPRRERIRAIRRRLGGTPRFAAPVPERPKGMHAATYERLIAELEAHEAKEWERRNELVARGRSPLEDIIEIWEASRAARR